MSEEKKSADLFEYTEEELLIEKVLNHYEILQLETYASQNDVKKAYRKRSLKYHPDKTGRGQDDYVFLAVKHAYDTLFDNDKRIAYDSTALDFDDSIPPPRSQLNDTVLYTDDDFYHLYGPVFARNLRFDLRLRPELAKQQQQQRKRHTKIVPPEFGDADTPIEDVHKFYEYWIHFESWRDFSAQASEELQIDTEFAESRFEKRYLQKEIDKRARKLKQVELQRINTLVERAMEADPRLRKHRREQQQLKEEERRQKQLAKEQMEREQQEEQKRQQEQLEREAEHKQKMKQLVRTERQRLRKACGVKHGDNEHVEYLCLNLDLDQLRDLNDTVSDAENVLAVVEEKSKSLQDQASAPRQKASSSVNDKPEGVPSKATESSPFTKEELSALAKGAKKYPPGSGGRWDLITSFVNNCTGSARSKDEYLAKYNQIARNNDASDKNGDKPVVESSWNASQDGKLQEALAKFPASMEKNERWNAIAKHTGKTKKECVQRFKQIREALKKQ